MTKEEGPSNVVGLDEARQRKEDRPKGPRTLEDRIAEFQLDVGKNGKPTGSYPNLMKLLTFDEEWNEAFRLDRRSLQIMVGKSPIHEGDTRRILKDADLVHIATWLGTEYAINASKDRVAQVVSAIADQLSFCLLYTSDAADDSALV